jgi:2-haloacid dehalogenase
VRPDPRPTLIFDLGGVLVDWDPRYLMASVIPDPERRAWFLEHVASPEFQRPVDAGRPFAEAVAERSARFPEWTAEIEAYAARGPEMVRGAVAGTEELLRDLHAAGAPLFALSNWPAETFWVARERFAVLEVFADVVVSGFVGLIKPDPRIYALALERFGRRARECAFVDDRPENVAAAAALGIDGVIFHDAASLRDAPAVRAWLEA